MFKYFFHIGKTPIKTLISYLFFISSLPSLYFSYQFGKYISLNFKYDKILSSSGNSIVSEKANNFHLGLIAGIITFILFIIFFKIVCEFLYLMFMYFKIHIEKSKPN